MSTTTKAEALAYLDRIRGRIELGPEAIPSREGALGVVLHAMVAYEGECCPDLGDLAHVQQAFVEIIEQAFASSAETFARRDP